MERTLIVAEDEAACKLFDCLVAYNRMVHKGAPSETSTVEDNITLGVLPTSELPAIKAKAPKSV